MCRYCVDDKSEKAAIVWAQMEEEEAERARQIKCSWCDEYYAENGMWFHDYSVIDGNGYVCPSCMVEYIWENCVDGIGYGPYLDFLEDEAKRLKKGMNN